MKEALCSYEFCDFCGEKMAALGGLWKREMGRPDLSLFNSIALAVGKLDRGTLWKPRVRQNLGPGVGSSQALAQLGACIVLFGRSCLPSCGHN